MTRRCTLLGHHFEPRYDEAPNGAVIKGMSGGVAEVVRAALYRRIYVHDVCVRCGTVVRRNAETDPPTADPSLPNAARAFCPDRNITRGNQ